MPASRKPKKPETELSYQEQKDIWYAKLEKSGFEDIEQDENNLKVWSSKFAHDRSIQLLESRQAYYHMATRFLNEHKFSSNIEKVIWEYHTEGIAIRDIVKVLNKVRKVKTSKTPVWLIVKRLENTMKAIYLQKPINE